MPGVCRALALTGLAPWLAGEATAEHVDLAAPGGPVERAHVVEDWERGQAAVVLAGLQNAPAVGVDLDSPDAAMAQQQAA
jgi:hypothetical protein